MTDQKIMLITGTSKGIGKYLTHYYIKKKNIVLGCSRSQVNYKIDNYHHFCLDVSDERKIKKMISEIRKTFGRLDILINNAGKASMNHFLLTPLSTMNNILNTNLIGTFLLCRESAKLMQKNKWGRIVNFSTVAVPLKLSGEAAYVSSKAAVHALTQVLAHELSPFGITVNSIGPTPLKTDLTRSVPKEKIDQLIQRQAIPRMGEFSDVTNVIDFFIRPESNFVSGQIIYLGGI
jgi:3-oxoacyl-[acyl-carrier protein] reductase